MVQASLIWCFLGLARLTMGGGIAGISRTAGVLGGVAIAGFASWGQPWPIIVANVVGLLVVMTLPHGPMLTLPIAQRSDGKIDYEYKLVAWIGDSELRWWAYTLLRYPGTAALWALALYLLGDSNYGSPIAGAFIIPILYRSLWPLRNALPQFNRPGDQVENWVELIGWTIFGAIIALVETI